MPRFRYSLRALFLAITLASVGLYWFGLPSLHAHRFVTALNSRDYPAAQRQFAKGKRPFPGRWTEYVHFEPRASLQPLTWQNILRRERFVTVGISYSDDDSGIASCAIIFRATPAGLVEEMAMP